MIERFWIFHCGWVRVPESAVFDDANALQAYRMPFLAAIAEHSELGPILVDAPFGHEGPANLSSRVGALLRRTSMHFSPSLAVVPRIEEMGLRPSRVRHVLMTHLHYDHTGGMKEMGHATFHVSRREWTFANACRPFEALTRGYSLRDFRALSARIEPFTFEDDFEPLVGGLDVFGDGSVEAIPLPGHTVGHVGYLFRRGDGRRIFFVGDAAFDTRQITEERGFGWMPRRFAADLSQAAETLRRLRRMHEDEGDVVWVSSHDTRWGRRALREPIVV